MTLRRDVDVDTLARELARWGRMGASMPNSHAHGDLPPIVDARTGKRLGRMLPGRGVSLPMDLRELGITKRIPFVHEYSRLSRVFDLLRSTKGALTTLAGTVSPQVLQECPFIISGTGGGTTAGEWLTGIEQFLRVQQDMPPIDSLNARATPGYTAAPGTAPDNTVAGSLGAWLTKPAGSNTKYLSGFSWLGTVASGGAMGMGIVADLLVECKFDCTIATLQTLNTTALTRYTNAIGVCAQAFANGDGTVSFTAGIVTFTVIYKNPGGTSHTSTFTGGGNTSGGVMNDVGTDGGTFPFMNLVSGDTGVKQIVSLQLSGTSAAGWGGLHLFKPLIFAPGTAALGQCYEDDSTTALTPLAQLATTAGGNLGCITLYCQDGSGSSIGEIRGTLTAVEG